VEPIQNPVTDPWLQQWLPSIRSHVGTHPILELGCGEGADTYTLTADGHRVIAIDLCASAIATAKIIAPTADYYCQDLRSNFPPQAAELGVAIASLSLHYFTWTETLAIVDRLRHTLQLNGLFMCRLNSTTDYNYGAIGHPQIAENYYLVDGEPKRFFDREAVTALFSNGWHSIAIAEKIIYKYELPKSVWEIILERST
jgi:SAM-dependent methyltransferase